MESRQGSALAWPDVAARASLGPYRPGHVVAVATVRGFRAASLSRAIRKGRIMESESDAWLGTGSEVTEALDLLSDLVRGHAVARAEARAWGLVRGHGLLVCRRHRRIAAASPRVHRLGPPADCYRLWNDDRGRSGGDSGPRLRGAWARRLPRCALGSGGTSRGESVAIARHHRRVGRPSIGCSARSAAVHHAAVGTTAAAVRAGIPSIAIPHTTDQFIWARRLNALGVSPQPIRRREPLRPGALVVSVITGAPQRARRRRSEPSQSRCVYLQSSTRILTTRGCLAGRSFPPRSTPTTASPSALTPRRQGRHSPESPTRWSGSRSASAPRA